MKKQKFLAFSAKKVLLGCSFTFLATHTTLVLCSHLFSHRWFFVPLLVLCSSSPPSDCIGAIDGTHIAAILPPNEQIPYIGRKDIPTQNVMAVYDFNMCFTFVMAGWEGSAHDTRIFLDAIRDPKYKFPHPPNGKYYLVDFGYPQMKCYLGPYRGQRYHLPDFRRGRPISGKEEIFNHSHSSLCSVIERTFGVLKKNGSF
ncbi:uncharacterized protein [Gossypium hirsutum]|uniref:Uncharacterized protein isoform X1 n=1 Tax=Gossypium hirsutum TaxID=3635 RepID=A0A1U8I2Z7_GOSHI|nr:uncharacterized protein LOC107892114 isoform X1 [Gossypium hirsutum]